MQERFAIVELRWSDAWTDKADWVSVFIGGQWKEIARTFYSPDNKIIQVYFTDGLAINEPVWKFSAFRVPASRVPVEVAAKKAPDKKAAKRERDRAIRLKMQSAKGQKNTGKR